MCEYKDFITAPEYPKTIADTIGSVACQAARTASFLDLYQAFEDAGLSPIVMKGILCRVLYGKYQDHRPSSDEDILIRQEDFPLLCQVMVSKGFTAENDTVTPQMLETLQEITFYDRQGGLHIEVHTNPMGHNTYVHQKMNTYFKDVFSKKFCVTIDGTKIWTMRPTDHLLFLILHALKNLMSSGFGIRQALDIYLFIQKYSADIDWDYISTSLKENQGESFFADLICIGNRYLGFHIALSYKSKCPYDLLEDMLGNGVFGNTTQAERTSISMVSAAIDRKTSSKSKAVIRAIFPSLKLMQERQPILVDKPWLLPICWAARWGRFFKYNKNNGGTLAQDSIKLSQHRIRLLKKYHII